MECCPSVLFQARGAACSGGDMRIKDAMRILDVMWMDSDGS
jgi:hypothetical protein